MTVGKDAITSEDIKNAKKAHGELLKAAEALHKRNAKDPKVVKFVADVTQEGKAITSWRMGVDKREQYTNLNKRVALLGKTAKQLLSSVKQADYVPEEVAISLKSTTKPKFMHNATAAGKLPVWTFAAVDAKTKKPLGTIQVNMTTQMTKDENTAKKMMADSALAEAKKEWPKAKVKLAGKV